jgi:hypothetical protein
MCNHTRVQKNCLFHQKRKGASLTEYVLLTPKLLLLRATSFCSGTSHSEWTLRLRSQLLSQGFVDKSKLGLRVLKESYENQVTPLVEERQQWAVTLSENCSPEQFWQLMSDLGFSVKLNSTCLKMTKNRKINAILHHKEKQQQKQQQQHQERQHQEQQHQERQH